MVHRVIKKSVKFALTLTLIASFSTPAFAQNYNQAGQQTGRAMSGPRKALATIVFSGLGGAVLGLSTLSFYGRPQDKLSNIAIGFAVGVIAGTTYVTYKAATSPADFYGAEGPGKLIPDAERLSMREAPFQSEPLTLGFSLTF